MTFTNGNSTKFFYSAEGEKLRAVHKTSGSTTQVDYCDNIIYEAGEQKYLLNQEGYFDLAAGGYHYYLKDHLGNNRVVITQSGAVEQTTHYYPYGGTFASSTTGQPYKYNGKELDIHNGLNWYDYGARHYDPAIARWTTQDPLAEKYYGWNQYNYCGANPILRIDSEGKIWETVWDAASLAMGVKSFKDNISQGNYAAAFADGVGILFDAAAVATPFVPGGVSAAISAARIVDKVDDVVDTGKGLKNAAAIAEGKAYGREMLQQAKERGEKVAGEIRLVLQNGSGNVSGNRTTVDQLIDNGDETYTIVETKLRKTTKLSPGQEAAQIHVEKGNQIFEVRSNVNELGLKKGEEIVVTKYIRKDKYDK